jgi:hypothetical protein
MSCIQKKGTGAFVISFYAGVRPGSPGPFLSGKGPKTMVAVAWSFGCPASFADLASPQGHGIPMIL